MTGNIVFSQLLREVRFLFCQTGAESNSIRSFLASAYPTMKKNNPHIPIMIREAAGSLPRVYARYAQGIEESVSLAGLSEKEIENRVSQLTQK